MRQWKIGEVCASRLQRSSLCKQASLVPPRVAEEKKRTHGPSLSALSRVVQAPLLPLRDETRPEASAGASWGHELTRAHRSVSLSRDTRARRTAISEREKSRLGYGHDIEGGRAGRTGTQGTETDGQRTTIRTHARRGRGGRNRQPRRDKTRHSLHNSDALHRARATHSSSLALSPPAWPLRPHRSSSPSRARPLPPQHRHLLHAPPSPSPSPAPPPPPRPPTHPPPPPRPRPPRASCSASQASPYCC